MVRQEFFVIRKRRILGELLGNAGMSPQELAEASHIIPIAETRPVTVMKSRQSIAGILSTVKTAFLPHEPIRVFTKLLSHFRVGLKKFMQCGMALNKLLVLDQRRILVQLFRYFRMCIHEPVGCGQFLMSYVAIACHPVIVAITFTPVETFFPAHESIRILAELFANPRMILQKFL